MSVNTVRRRLYDAGLEEASGVPAAKKHIFDDVFKKKRGPLETWFLHSSLKAHAGWDRAIAVCMNRSWVIDELTTAG